MLVELEAEKQQLYSRLYVSSMDLSAAKFSLSMLLKKGWYAKPWERRGSIYAQQTAFVTAFVVAYARPFNKSIGWPKFPLELMPFTEQEHALHGRIIAMRNTIIAHSDSSFYSIRPWQTKEFSTDIVGAPPVVIEATECAMLQSMIDKIQKAITRKLTEILPSR